ncbi:bifunctional protein: zinc-containing alcohol dehydrogenase [Phellopilus nigrolimitatus]|nr:bifunctional protein: zinc-containing alcohol dehydrogenase [Phellopilus nigrolimitatus]
MSLQNPIPSTQFAVFRTPAAAQLHPLPVPAPGPGEVLVQNVAVASNPKDWKYPEWQGGDYSYVEGNDVAGLIAAVGPGVTEYKRGARVAALTRMGTGFNPEHMATKENKGDDRRIPSGT